MIDLSDGLATDAGHIGRASGAHLRVSLAALPLEAGVAEIAGELGLPAWQLAASAGEDYELCFCVPAAARTSVQDALAGVGGAPVSWIGEVTEGPPGVSLLDEHGEEVPLSGFEHRW
jgi:thiamine-monophosphate kinase